MPPKPIIDLITSIDEVIIFEKETILISQMRIEEQRMNFMLSRKIKILNINILKRRIADCEERIKELEARKVILSTV